jgi:hypothetical protein
MMMPTPLFMLSQIFSELWSKALCHVSPAPPEKLHRTYIWIAKALTKTVDNIMPLLRKKVLRGVLAEVYGWSSVVVEDSLVEG